MSTKDDFQAFKDHIAGAARKVNTPGRMADALNNANKPKNAQQAAVARGKTANAGGHDPSKIKDPRLAAALAKPTSRVGRE